MPRDRFSNLNRLRGFTLLELLVAIALLTMLATLGWRALDSMLRTREALAQRDEQTESLRQLLTQLDSDCKQLTSTDAMQDLPILLADNRLLLVRERHTETPDGNSTHATQWQVTQYRLSQTQIEYRTSPPISSLQDLHTAMHSLYTDSATSTFSHHILLDRMAGLRARIWVAPFGWVNSTEALRHALIPTSPAAGDTPTSAEPAVIRAIELTVTETNGNSYTKICLTGL